MARMGRWLCHGECAGDTPIPSLKTSPISRRCSWAALPSLPLPLRHLIGPWLWVMQWPLSSPLAAIDTLFSIYTQYAVTVL